MSIQPCAYIMASRPNGTLYVSATSNLPQRIWQHKQGVVAGFTRQYDVKNLVWYEFHEDMFSAILREKSIKKWSRFWKLQLIESANPEWRDLYQDLG